MPLKYGNKPHHNLGKNIPSTLVVESDIAVLYTLSSMASGLGRYTIDIGCDDHGKLSGMRPSYALTWWLYYVGTSS